MAGPAAMVDPAADPPRREAAAVGEAGPERMPIDGVDEDDAEDGADGGAGGVDDVDDVTGMVSAAGVGGGGGWVGAIVCPCADSLGGATEPEAVAGADTVVSNVTSVLPTGIV